MVTEARHWRGEESEGEGQSHQGEQKAADGARSLTEGAVFLQQQRDELVGLRGAQRCNRGPRRSGSLGTCRKVLQQAHLRFQDILTSLLL